MPADPVGFSSSSNAAGRGVGVPAGCRGRMKERRDRDPALHGVRGLVPAFRSSSLDTRQPHKPPGLLRLMNWKNRQDPLASHRFTFSTEIYDCSTRAPLLNETTSSGGTVPPRLASQIPFLCNPVNPEILSKTSVRPSAQLAETKTPLPTRAAID